MAWGGATPALLSSGETGSFGSTVVTDASISPTAGALLIAVLSAQRAGGDTEYTSISDTLSLSTAWARVSDGSTSARSQYTGGSLNPTIEVWWAIAGGTPGSSTVTGNTGTSCPVRTIAVFEVASGFDPAPWAQVDIGTATTSTSPSGALTSTPATDSLLLSVFHAHGSGAAVNTDPGTGYTELYDLVGNASHKQGQYADGDNGSSFGWAGLDITPAEQVFIGLEISAEAASGGGAVKLIGGSLVR